MQARGDSVDLGIIEALRRRCPAVRGLMSVDVNVGGTWNTPVAGAWRFARGRCRCPGLGVRYGNLHGGARFQGDSLVLNKMTLSEAAAPWVSPAPSGWKTWHGRSSILASGPTLSGPST